MWGRSDARYQGDVTPVAFYPASPWKALMSLARWRPSPRSIATLLAWRQRLVCRGGDSARDRAEGLGKGVEPSAETASLFAVATTPGAPGPMEAAHGGGSR